MYGYVGGSPTIFTDPTGQIYQWLVPGLLGVGGALWALYETADKMSKTINARSQGAIDLVNNPNPSAKDADPMIDAQKRLPGDIGEVIKKGAELEKKIIELRIPQKRTPPYERKPQDFDKKRCQPGTCCR